MFSQWSNAKQIRMSQKTSITLELKLILLYGLMYVKIYWKELLHYANFASHNDMEPCIPL